MVPMQLDHTMVFKMAKRVTSANVTTTGVARDLHAATMTDIDTSDTDLAHLNRNR